MTILVWFFGGCFGLCFKKTISCFSLGHRVWSFDKLELHQSNTTKISDKVKESYWHKYLVLNRTL